MFPEQRQLHTSPAVTQTRQRARLSVLQGELGCNDINEFPSELSFQPLKVKYLLTRITQKCFNDYRDKWMKVFEVITVQFSGSAWEWNAEIISPEASLCRVLTLTLLSLLQWVSQREGGVATRIDLTALFGGPRPSTVNRVNIFMLLFFWHMEKNMHKRQ